MPHFNNPIPRSGLPQFSESSSLRSIRDSASTGRLWQKAKSTTVQERVNTRAIQQLQRRIEQLRRRIVGAGYIDEDTTEEPSNGVYRFTVHEVKGDYVSARKVDDDENANAEVINIAKPYHLRHSLVSQNISGVAVTYGSYAIDGGNCSRLAGASGYANQSEMVIPQYQLSNVEENAVPMHTELLAVEPSGGTNVTDNSNTVEILWIDINADARAWCQYY